MREISILIVEDEALTAMFMEKMLRRKGFNILKCISSGEDALVFALIYEPDIVIMDIRLAGNMDGIELASRIRTGIKKNIQFIFSTGYSDPELKDKAMILEPLAFLIKPVDLKILDVLIKSCFSK